MFHVLEHFRYPQLALNEALRVSHHVHAKFPYKYDRVPSTLRYINGWRGGWYDVLMHILTQLRIMDHPLHHKWLVQPFGSYKLNRFPIFPPNFFGSGRKARFLKYIPRIMMNAEWECYV